MQFVIGFGGSGDRVGGFQPGKRGVLGTNMEIQLAEGWGKGGKIKLVLQLGYGLLFIKRSREILWTRKELLEEASSSS